MFLICKMAAQLDHAHILSDYEIAMMIFSVTRNECASFLPGFEPMTLKY